MKMKLKLCRFLPALTLNQEIAVCVFLVLPAICALVLAIQTYVK